MATWPESSPTPNYPLEIVPRFKTLVSGMDAGNEQRRSKQEFPVFDVLVTYDGYLTKTEMDTLWNFFLARKGRYEAFYIYNLADVANSTSTDYDDLYLGTGDGATDTFDIPGRSTSSQAVYVDNVVQTLTTDYSISAGTGNSGADQVVFVSAPAAGEILTIDFTGLLRMRVRFDLDNGLTRSLFETVFYRAGGIQLHGLKAAI